MAVLINPVDVPTAAEMLGISQTRVKNLIADHHLPAIKIGHVWAIPHGNILARLDMDFPSTRPYAPERTWQTINTAEVAVRDGVRYRRRGRPTRWYRGTGVPDEVVGELGGMLSGNPASAELLERIAPFHDIGVPTLGVEHDVYLPCSKHRELVDSTGWVMSTQGSTVIRFVNDDVWDIAVSCAAPSVEYPGLLLAPLAAVALDLMPCSGARNRDAAWALMRHKEQILDAA